MSSDHAPLLFAHVLAASLFIGTIFATLIWKTYIEWHSQDTGVRHLSNKLVLWLDGLVLCPAVVVLYFSGRWLAEAKGLPIGGTFWIGTSLLLLIISGVIWLALLVPVEVYMLRQTGKGVPQAKRYRAAFWLWLVAALVIKVLPLVSLWLMLAKPT